MISNERPSPYGRAPYGQPRAPVQEDTLKSATIQIERKTFVFTLKENRAAGSCASPKTLAAA